MKKSEFKKLIKPIVQECIKESLLEDGLISGIIAEVVKGMSSQTIVETKTPQPKVDPKLKEHKRKLMAAIGGSAYNGVDLFEGTTPAPAQAAPSTQTSPMSGQAPNDPGVDIAKLFGAVGRNWNAHMNEMKERE
jgi:hypothetical protein